MQAADKVEYTCNRCGKSWVSRSSTQSMRYKVPNNCAKCKSPYWNKPRIKVVRKPNLQKVNFQKK